MITWKPTETKSGNPISTFFKFDQSHYRPVIVDKIACPCGLGQVKAHRDKWVGRCNACKRLHTFISLHPFQTLIQQTANRIVAVFGGVGSAKTVNSAAIFSEDMRTIPGITIYAAAQTLDQLKQTSVVELSKFFLDDEWSKKNETVWVHKNGSKIYWITSDGEQKLRGRNAGKIWLMEASSIPHEFFVQSTQRIRQDTTKVRSLDAEGKQEYIWDAIEERYEMKFLRDKSQILIETNPHLGWVRTNLLLKSHTIVASTSVRGMESIKKLAEPGYDPETKKPMDMVSFLFASVDNPLMTSDYLETIRSNAKTREEYERDIYCDMSFSQGLVFGNEIDSNKIFTNDDGIIHDYMVDGVNTFWVEGLDPGGSKKGNDPTAYVIGILQVYPGSLPKITPIDYFKESGLTIFESAAKIKELRRKLGWTREKSKFFVADPSAKRLDRTRQTYQGDLAKMGIYINTDVNNDISFGLMRLKTLIRLNRFKVHYSLKDMVKEIKEYRWSDDKVVTSKTTKKQYVLPIGGKDHLLDVIRYMAVKATTASAFNKFDNVEELKETPNMTQDKYAKYEIGKDDEETKSKGNITSIF